MLHSTLPSLQRKRKNGTRAAHGLFMPGVAQLVEQGLVSLPIKLAETPRSLVRVQSPGTLILRRETFMILLLILLALLGYGPAELAFFHAHQIISIILLILFL